MLVPPSHPFFEAFSLSPATFTSNKNRPSPVLQSASSPPFAPARIRTHFVYFFIFCVLFCVLFHILCTQLCLISSMHVCSFMVLRRIVWPFKISPTLYGNHHSKFGNLKYFKFKNLNKNKTPKSWLVLLLFQKCLDPLCIKKLKVIHYLTRARWNANLFKRISEINLLIFINTQSIFQWSKMEEVQITRLHTIYWLLFKYYTYNVIIKVCICT